MNKDADWINRFKNELKLKKKSSNRLVLASGVRAFVQWHFGRDLLKLPEYNEPIVWPHGVYRIWDIETDIDYLYFDPEEIRYSDLRFELGRYNIIEKCLNIKETEPDRENYRVFEVRRGINGALTFVKEGKDESN